jgi:M6 family metalloprotease-like protein
MNRRGNKYVAFLTVLLILAASGSVYSASISHLGTNQKVLVICVKWSDYPTTRLATAKDWVKLLAKETNKFYQQATFSQTTFQFETINGGPSNGWLSLGYASNKYEFFKTIQDAVKLADPYANFKNYHRMVVITNHPKFGGVGGGPWWWAVNEGGEATYVENGKSVSKRAMTVCVVNEWTASGHSGSPFDEGASVVAHEVGHQLALPTHYHSFNWNGVKRDSITPWDVMGLSPGLNHFLGWAKAHRQWIPASRIKSIGPPVGANLDTTVTLKPLESSTTGIQLISIPVTFSSINKGFQGYVVENRRKINGDGNIPSQGVLLTVVNESVGPGRQAIVLYDPGSPNNLKLAPLEVGDTYDILANNIKITVLSQSGNDYKVRVQYGLPPSQKPDPKITPWKMPPWETPDIWIDSQKNGWGTYKFKDSAGQPVGNGDEAWVGHSNRLYVRVTNGGKGTATNVRVRVFINDPPGMGAAGKSWKYSGTIFFSSILPGKTVQDFVLWRPKVGKHTCVKAEIENNPVELSTTNNTAQENVAHFDTSKSSPYEPVGLRIRVDNPSRREETPVYLNVRNIPLGWAVRVEPQMMWLPPGDHGWVEFEIFASGAPDGRMPPELEEALRDDKYSPGYIGKPSIEALVPFEDTFVPIGGVDAWVHLVQRTWLDLELMEHPERPDYEQERREAMERERVRREQEEAAARERERVRHEQEQEAERELARREQEQEAERERAQYEQEQRAVREREPAIEEMRPLTPEDLAWIGHRVPRLDELPRFEPGREIGFVGELGPAVGGAQVAVQFTSGERTETLFAHSSGSGTFRLYFIPPEPGIWNAQAFFSGDDIHGAAQSELVKFEIIGDHPAHERR